jgi:hypothetical protein
MGILPQESAASSTSEIECLLQLPMRLSSCDEKKLWGKEIVHRHQQGISTQIGEIGFDDMG